MPNTKIDSKATHVSAVVAFAPNGGKLSEAFEWFPVEAEANVSSIFTAARRKAVQFMSYEQAQNSTCFVIDISQQWDVAGIAI